MAAYHSVSVTLGQAGLLKELIKIIDCMKEKPKKIKNMRRKNWDPVLLPDIVVYNAVGDQCILVSEYLLIYILQSTYWCDCLVHYLMVS